MTRSGELFPLPMLERHTSASGGGLWPTPTRPRDHDSNHSAGRARDGEDFLQYRGWDLATAAAKWHIPGKGEGLSKTAKMWPTPNAGNWGSSTNHDGTRKPFLEQSARMFPTPRAGKTTDEDEESWLARHAAGKVATPPRALAARMLPTPSSGGDSGGPHGIRGGSWAKEKLVETFGEEDAVAMSGGSLSPDWVSWLMGLPVGWTSLELLPREEYLDWLHAQQDGTWWLEERGLPRVATGIPNRVSRLKCLGNGIVPASLSLFLRGTSGLHTTSETISASAVGAVAADLILA